MRTYFSLKFQLKKSSLLPNPLQDTQVEGWGEMLEEMREFWLEDKATTLETSYFEYFEGSDAVENRFAKGNNRCVVTSDIQE